MSDLHNDARATIKTGMAQCTQAQRDLFIRRFAPDVTDINKLIDTMPIGQLPWAIAQMTNMLVGNDE